MKIDLFLLKKDNFRIIKKIMQGISKIVFDKTYMLL